MNEPEVKPMSQLPILVGGRLAIIPFPMPLEDFELMIDTLNLWKKRLTGDSSPSILGEELPPDGSNNNADQPFISQPTP